MVENNPSHMSSADGLTVKAYRSDGSVLLAFDLEPSLTPNLAGFAIRCTQPDGRSYYLRNRLSMSQSVTQKTATEREPSEPSNQAPFQKFRWTVFSSKVIPGAYRYTVTAMYFDPGGDLKNGPSAQVSVELIPIQSGPLAIGFTRGFLTSQAYATEFHNAPITPTPKSITYDTSPFEAQYAWLGHQARKMVMDFLHECLANENITLDVFAYDLDEPAIIRALTQMGPRLRAVLDNASLHTRPNAMEPLARQALLQSAGADHIVSGHFQRFAHNKVLIQKRNGRAVKVLTGSANFSVRGLYVQDNNVLVFDDPTMAGYYEDAFQVAFTNMAHFKKQPISQQWFSLPASGFDPYAVCFSPHADSNLSLKVVADAIAAAQSSVLFAVMELTGGGATMSDLLSLGSRPTLFSYGISQSLAGMHLYPPGQPNAILTPFAALDAHVPPPFDKEWRGGRGEVIHHKFVVVDFNGVNPAVFTGSSNLSAGGEAHNGDNLIAIYDPLVVEAYAVEAVRLVDHYHFRAAQHQSTDDKPLHLESKTLSGREWWRPYYDPSSIKYHDRMLFAKQG
jgi:hypothetical protein